MQWENIARETIQGYQITKAEALQILSSADDDLLDVLNASLSYPATFFRARRRSTRDTKCQKRPLQRGLRFLQPVGVRPFGHTTIRAAKCGKDN
jgi:hypothetical protein